MKSAVNILNNYLETSEDSHACLFHSNLKKRNRVSLAFDEYYVENCKFWIYKIILLNFLVEFDGRRGMYSEEEEERETKML